LTEHVDIDKNNITSAAVSHEAGFDRGYLKKAREQHKPLIAKIEAQRTSNKGSSTSSAELLRRAKNKEQRAIANLNEANKKIAMTLTQNLQLVSRVRELENQLSHYQNTLDLK
jgi:predicted Zn-dependent peptidase